MAKNYTAFGETHGLREWARVLNVNKDTLRYWLTTKGLTLEEFVAKNGIEYTQQIDEEKMNINRLAQAEDVLRALFDRSGYPPELVKTQRIAGQRKLYVFYGEERVGYYVLDSGSLHMRDEGVNLLDYPVMDPKIFRHPEGWGVHPITREEVVKKINAQCAHLAF